MEATAVLNLSKLAMCAALARRLHGRPPRDSRHCLSLVTWATCSPRQEELQTKLEFSVFEGDGAGGGGVG